MKTLKISLNLLVVALLVVMFSSAASAQATRTWVSGVGDDANPCSRTAPCKTFAGAISKTAASGEIDCLDPGGFGALTITKSITLDCGGVTGGVLVAGTNGISIVGGTSLTVTLRNLNFQGVGAGLAGVSVTTSAASTVHLFNVEISGFTGTGVDVNATASVTLTMEDCRIHDNAGHGIRTTTSAGLVTGDYSHVSVWSNPNGSGAVAQNGSRIQIHNSTFVANNIGVNQNNLVALGSTVTVFGSSFTGNGTATQSIAGATMGVSGNVFSTNSMVFNLNGGTISSAGNDNFLFGNAGTGALSAATPKI